MYEEYMQNFLNYPRDDYQNTYDQMMENSPYNYPNPNMYGYNMPLYNFQNRNIMQNSELENYYPEIYKIIYPMVKKICTQKRGGYSQQNIDNMVDEIYSNIEENDAIKLNITINNEIRTEGEEKNQQNRQERRNNLLSDIIRILIVRELFSKTDCIGSNCRPYINPQRPNYWQRPPFSRYDYGN